jgi:putative protease
MSSLIGGRSGNRGACAGSCRLKYDIVDENGNKLNKGEYPLSTKDLNSLEHVGELIDAGIASFKIEGRMKSPEYVYMVVSLYRKAIDSYYKYGYVKIDDDEILMLKKIFNRNFTRGFLLNTDNNDLINGYRPNHMGVPVGKVIDYRKGFAKIKLTDSISIGSGLRVIGKKNDVGISVNEIYVNNNLVKKASKGDIVNIKVNGEVNIDDIVVITMDKEISDNIEDIINSNLRKVNISGKFYGHVGKEMSLTLSDGIHEVNVSGSLVDASLNRPMDKDTIHEKLNKLGDTVYKFDTLDIDIDNNIFIPIKEINELRREACDKLNELRLYKSDFKKCEYSIDVPNFDKERLVTCLVNDIDKYNYLDKKYDIVYSEEIIDNTIYKLPRVIKEYKNSDKLVMVGDIGAFNKLKNVDTDFSLNVVNSYTVAFLHSLGAKKVTLSYELNDNQIKDIIDNYHDRYKKHPNVELIVDAYEEVMISKFSLNKYFDNHKIYLRDMFKNKYRVITKNNLMYIYNYKKRDNYNTKYYDMGVNSLRINLDI